MKKNLSVSTDNSPLIGDMTSPKIDFQLLFESAPGLNLILDLDLTILAISNDLIATIKKQRAELVGRKLFEIFPAPVNGTTGISSETNLKASLEFILKNGEAHSMPAQKYEVKYSDNTTSSYQWLPYNKPVFNSAGKVIYIIHQLTDTANNSPEADQQIHFRNTLDKMLEGIEIIDFHWRYLYVNEAYEKQVHHTKEQLVGFTVMEKFPGIEETMIFKRIQQCFDERKAIYMVDSFTFPNGKTQWFEMSFQPIPEGVFILSVDITERKKAESEIILSEKRFRGLIENSFDTLWVADENFLPTYRSPNLEKILGWTIHEIEEYGDISLVYEEDQKVMIDVFEETKSNPRKVIPFTIRAKHKQGHLVWLEGTMINLLDDPNVRGIISNSRDITQRKEAEDKVTALNQELIFNERKFRRMIEHNHDLIGMLNEKNEAVYRSPSHWRVTGWTSEEFAAARGNGRPFDLMHPDDRDRIRQVANEALSKPGIPLPLRYRFKHKDGHYLWLDGTITNLLHDESIKCIVTNLRDITDQIQAEEEIKRSERIYKTIASSIPGSVICLFDSEYRYTLIEGDMLEKVGYAKNILLGSRAIDVIPPERFEYVKNAYDRVFSGESFSVETIREGYDIITHFVPLKNDDGEVYMAMSVGIDITELKNAHRAISELNINLEHKVTQRTEQLAKLNKELESFSYSISHDLRAPLRAVNGYAKMLADDYTYALDENGKRLLSVVQSNAVYMGKLIDELLAFSRLGRKEIQKTSINMTRLTEDIIGELRHLNPDAEIKISILHTAWGDLTLLRQVVFNYLSNAFKYSSKSAKPMIEIKSALKDNFVVYAVIDNGAGFDMRYSNKLFKVFQRLHSAEEFEGTGVGLAIVDRIITKHGGKVWAEGEIDKGASFYFSLPRQS